MFRPAPSVLAIGSLLLFASSGALTGCAADATADDAEADESAVTSAQQHAARVQGCIVKRDKTLETATSQAAMNKAVADAITCVKKANDATVAQIEKKLKELPSTLVGSTKATFKAQRESASVQCATLADAGESAGGSLGRLEQASCLLDREQLLAIIIDAYADLGGEEIAAPADYDAHQQCFAAFDAVVDSAPENAEYDGTLLSASSTLTTCVEADVKALATPLAERVVETFPDRVLADEHTKAEKAFDLSRDATAATCALLADAGRVQDGTIARVFVASCRTDAAASLGRTARSFVNRE